MRVRLLLVHCDLDLWLSTAQPGRREADERPNRRTGGVPVGRDARDVLGDEDGTRPRGHHVVFSPNLVSYIDATLGWAFDSYEVLRGVFAEAMPKWAPSARSHTTGVLSNEASALVHMVDTPELFGGE